MKALAKNPQDRFDNIMTFAIALEHAVLGHTNQTIKLSPIPNIPSMPSALTIADKKPSIPPQSPLNRIEQLFQQGVQAKTSGNIEEAFRIWKQIIATPDIDEKYSTPARKGIQEIRPQIIPLRIKHAREAHMQGRWEDEIHYWKDLLMLEPLKLRISFRKLTLSSFNRSAQFKYGAGYRDRTTLKIKERLRIAQQNENFSWMYKGVQRSIQNTDNATAKSQLQMLWSNAPYYGDPDKLAQSIGLHTHRNYEQAIAIHFKKVCSVFILLLVIFILLLITTILRF